MRLIAIDPGDVYTGVAFFNYEVNGYTGEVGPWFCEDAQEFDPREFEDALMETVTDASVPLEAIVYERFRLYEDKSPEQVGSEFLTAQSIGVIKAIHRWHEQHVTMHEEAEANKTPVILPCETGGRYHSVYAPRHIELVGQMADIKKPTAGICRKRKIKSVAGPIARDNYHGRDHIKDAELHGIHYIMRTLEAPYEGAP